jgi:hypothetical protein
VLAGILRCRRRQLRDRDRNVLGAQIQKEEQNKNFATKPIELVLVWSVVSETIPYGQVF